MKHMMEYYKMKTSFCCLRRIYSSYAQTGRFLDLSQIQGNKDNTSRKVNFLRNCEIPYNIVNRDRNLLCVRTLNVFDQQRHLSIDTYNKYFASDVPPIKFAEKTLEKFHDITGLPWWVSIALTTFTLRTLLTLPLGIYGAIIQTRLEMLRPEITDISNRLRIEVKHATQKYKWSEKKSRIKYNETMKKKVSELYIRNNCHPMKTAVGIWAQLPIWISLSFALRNMSGAIPVLGLESTVKCASLKTEGAFWFKDLTIPDSTFLLPLCLGISALLNIEIHALEKYDGSKFRKRLTMFLRGIAMLFILISSTVPSSMCCYWVMSNLFGLLQNILIRLPKVRRFLRIQKCPSESATPFRDMLRVAKTKYRFREKAS